MVTIRGWNRQNKFFGGLFQLSNTTHYSAKELLTEIIFIGEAEHLFFPIRKVV